MMMMMVMIMTIESVQQRPGWGERAFRLLYVVALFQT
jgi:hypothetical protein